MQQEERRSKRNESATSHFSPSCPETEGERSGGGIESSKPEENSVLKGGEKPKMKHMSEQGLSKRNFLLLFSMVENLFDQKNISWRRKKYDEISSSI
ncbi:hypothetical protein CDAR_289851 [Caerostris darwini]|uniref:Uncharacterized protein n=1 Tax=Caerostris darwini TaxID=1538125 RepID=A0AAV4WWS4_9ARAC|nr:hypothetical protein CDAR_289851 [Caerostris darwini]